MLGNQLLEDASHQAFAVAVRIVRGGIDEVAAFPNGFQQCGSMVFLVDPGSVAAEPDPGIGQTRGAQGRIAVSRRAG